MRMLGQNKGRSPGLPGDLGRGASQAVGHSEAGGVPGRGGIRWGDD